MADAPDQSSVLIDVNKQIVTVSSAILALASAYATAVVGKDLSWWQGVWLALCGVALVLSICCALASHAQVIGYIKEADANAKNGYWWWAAGLANIGYFAFAASFAFLLAFVGLRISEDNPTLETIVAEATESLTKAGRITDRGNFVSLTQNGSTYEIVFQDTAGERIVCEADGKSGVLSPCR
ncbi:MAG: hypothetical protein KDA37_12955 [Planctomycetales bacterium]|nr:hypothetical protein [Planctomycetales bacterium]